MAEGEKIIGIDLGTTNSVVAVMEGGDVTVVPNQEGSRLTPSVVAFTGKGEVLVGEPAKRQAVTNPKGTVYSIKRFMGRRHSEVQSEEKMVPYEVVGGPDEFVRVRVNGKEYTPQEISAYILRKLKEAAESHLGHKVRKAVITVPAYFNDSQRQATKDAGQIAGLEVARIINEPTAAALAYGLDKKKNEKIAVFDLGGGTFDVSILEVADGVFEVLSTNGDTHLGGDDWDEALINYIADQFKKEQGIDLRKDQMALQRLKEAAEKAKKDLSFQAQADINLPFITADQTGPKHLTMTITRSQFEQLTDHLFERLRGPVLKALEDAKLEGVRHRRSGAGRRRDPHAAGPGDRQGDLRQGAAQGGQPRRSGRRRRGHPGCGTGRRREGRAPARRDPAVARPGDQGRRHDHLVPRNTTIPTEKKETFTTAEDNQAAVTIKVFQGERPMAGDNRLLGEFNLEGIPPAPMGTPQIEVGFNIDANGILQVSARDKGTGKEQTIKIESSGGLSKEEIDRMQRDAQAHAAEDELRRELADTRNAAEQRVYQLQKLIDENKDRLSDADTAAVRSAIERVNQVKAGDDPAEIRRAVEDLDQASQAMMQHLYAPSATAGRRSAQNGPSSSSDGREAPDGEEVVDAEFEEKR